MEFKVTGFASVITASLIACCALLVKPNSSHADLLKGCNSSDPDYLCLRLKYVVYEDENLHPVVGAQSVESNMSAVNAIWKKCRIGFEIDHYVETDPVGLGLSRDAATFDDLDHIRKTFADQSSLLVVTARRWEKGGLLSASPANAWTKMPGTGTGIYGVVLERRAAGFPNLLAHELGHYLNLSHADEAESHDLMSQIIDRDSTDLTPKQCETARAAVKQWWQAALRHPEDVVADKTAGVARNLAGSVSEGATDR